MNDTKPTVITINDIVAELATHGWNHLLSKLVLIADLEGVVAVDDGKPVIAHLFIATNEVGGVMEGIIVTRPNGVTTTHSLNADFDGTVDFCARTIMARHAAKLIEEPVNTLTAPLAHTLH